LTRIAVVTNKAAGATDSYLREQQAFHSSTFNRILLTLSGGALVLSVTFIGDLTKNPEHTWLVLVGWVLLIGSVLSIAASHYWVANAFTAAFHNNEEEDKRLSTKGRKAAISSAGLFGVGLLALALFAFWNI